ncbi:MAG: DoxX family protein [Erythrobacter sp.]|uniref:DoxX family protein n=1 Tax=Erythrobacter sp. TaxID=1042 RepID=UPI003A84E946
MFERILTYADMPARAAMSAIFILSGVSKLSEFAATQGYMEAFGLPGALLAPTIAFEIGAGMALLLGIAVRQVAFVLAGFSLVTALIFHGDPSDQIQTIMFLKNVAMAGGLLLLAQVGSSHFRLDRIFKARGAMAS